MERQSPITMRANATNEENLMLKPFKIRYYKDPQFNKFRYELILDNRLLLLTDGTMLARDVLNWLTSHSRLSQQDINIVHSFLSARRLGYDSTLECMVEVN